MTSKLVYSTSVGDQRNKKGAADQSKSAKGAPATGGPIKMRLEKNGRGGKLVTVLFNIALSDAEATALMKEMQGKFGVGATFKNGQMEFRGDLRDRIEAFLQSRSMKVIRAGG